VKKPLFGALTNAAIPIQLGFLTVIMAGAIWLGYNFFTKWPGATDVGRYFPQPIPFSHEHHAGHMMIACGFCHTSADSSPSAGLPATHTCMTCHSQVWKNSQVLSPVRDSYRTGQPIAWRRVHIVPDFAYFSHEPHISHGISCSDCHGQVEKMTTVWKVRPLNMKDCLNCHKREARLTTCYVCHR
jgi:hypothetical protein